MAETPKTPRSTPRSKAGSSTLSASQALKAAEAAIGGEPVKPKDAPKPAPRKVAAASVKPVDGNPQALQAKPIAAKPPVTEKSADPVAAATAPAAAAKAAPEPAKAPAPVAAKAAAEPIKAAPPKVEQPQVELAAAPAKAEPKITQSLTKATSTATQMPATEGKKIMNEVIENGKKFAEETKAKFETAYADLNEKTKAHVEKSTKAIEELSDIAKGNVEALVESSKIAAKGMETLGQEAVDYSRKSFEKATASFKSFSTAKTPTEFFQLQSQLLSTSFDEFTKEAAKNSEALMKLAGDVAQPLTARMTLVTDKVKSLAA